jgi:hypothetical protein
MRRSALPVLVIACVVVAAVLAWMVVARMFHPAPSDDTSGPTVAETRTPGKFSKIDVSGNAILELVQADRFEVIVEVAEGDQDRVRTVVEGSTLTIVSGARDGWRPFHGVRRTPRIIVTAPTLEAIASAGKTRISAPSLVVPALRIAASGATTIRIDDLKADSLRIAGSGAVKADLAGKVTDLTVSLSGAGDIRAPRLAAETANVSVAGAGNVVVFAEKSLRVSLSGAGNVEYLGNPEVKQSVSGLGRVKRRDSDATRARTWYQVALA